MHIGERRNRVGREVRKRKKGRYRKKERKKERKRDCGFFGAAICIKGELRPCLWSNLMKYSGTY